MSINEGKIIGLKSHDCHVLLQRLLPIGIRSFLRKDVCTVLVELCKLFQDLRSRTLNVLDLDRLDNWIVLIYPPSFFDVVVHLVVHLSREAKIVGPVGYSWMYSIERYYI